MNPEIKAQWLAALRSGEYEQGKMVLSNSGQYCCLGVLCELAFLAGGIVTKDSTGADVRYGTETGLLPFEVQKWAGLKESNPSVSINGELYAIAGVNDGTELSDGSWLEARTFSKIADLIDAQL